VLSRCARLLLLLLLALKRRIRGRHQSVGKAHLATWRGGGASSRPSGTRTVFC